MNGVGLCPSLPVSFLLTLENNVLSVSDKSELDSCSLFYCPVPCTTAFLVPGFSTTTNAADLP